MHKEVTLNYTKQKQDNHLHHLDICVDMCLYLQNVNADYHSSHRESHLACLILHLHCNG
ncbi:unknown [Salmonella phage FelixO1]|uniref:Uncharacterized protein n=1 Tax=Salmonella phage Felix O1 (isolate Felix O1-VT1) TaxID=1283336 RepID=Q6KGN6_BPFO1|nr:unknown [Salmonella phage FelixO1]